MGSWASATNGSFINVFFCSQLTGQSGPSTFVNYSYVSDYGNVDGSTVFTWSERPPEAVRGCSITS